MLRDDATDLNARNGELTMKKYVAISLRKRWRHADIRERDMDTWTARRQK